MRWLPRFERNRAKDDFPLTYMVPCRQYCWTCTILFHGWFLNNQIWMAPNCEKNFIHNPLGHLLPQGYALRSEKPKSYASESYDRLIHKVIHKEMDVYVDYIIANLGSRRTISQIYKRSYSVQLWTNYWVL